MNNSISIETLIFLAISMANVSVPLFRTPRRPELYDKVSTRQSMAAAILAAPPSVSKAEIASYRRLPTSFGKNVGQTDTGTAVEHDLSTTSVADITTFGARSTSSVPSTTATCVSGSKNVTLGDPSTFQKGDGITLRGCGATIMFTTPAAPTVTPSIAIAGTALGGGNDKWAVVNSGIGTSTYSYRLIFRDKAGGYSAVGTATTITNGLSTIGPIHCTISTYALSGTTLTVDFTAPCAGAVAGARMHLTGASNALFVGWFNISNVVSSTEVQIWDTGLDSASMGWQASDATSATGGTAGFYLSNHVQFTNQTNMWEAYVCAERPGDNSYALIGVTKPSVAGVFYDLQYDDYGSPFNDSQTYPAYITNSLCNSSMAQNDPLTTTVVSGAGTTSIVVADAAANNASGLTAIYDDAPAIQAAATSISSYTAGLPGGVMLIPTGHFHLNSYLQLPSGIEINQAGTLALNETLELQGTYWEGESDPGNYALVQIGTANPGIYVGHGQFVTHKNLGVSIANQNGGTVEVYDSTWGGTWDGFGTGTDWGTGGPDTLSMTLVLRQNDPAGDGQFEIVNSGIKEGPTQALDATWTPGIYIAPNQNGSGDLQHNQDYYMTFSNDTFWIRGIEEDVCGGYAGLWTFSSIVRLGGIVPLLSINSCYGSYDIADVSFDGVIQDTESVGTLAMGGNTGTINTNLNMQNVQNSSIDSGSDQIPPPVTGYQPLNVVQDNNSTGEMPTTTGYGDCPILKIKIFCVNEPMALSGSNSYIYSPGDPVTNVVATLAVGGRALPATYEFAITYTGPNGGKSTVSSPSNAVTTDATCGAPTYSGNCRAILVWDSVPEATGGYDVWVCGLYSGCPVMRHTAHVSTNSYTFNRDNSADYAPGTSMTGPSGMDASVHWAPKMQLIVTPYASLGSTCNAALAGTMIYVSDSSMNTWGATIDGAGSGSSPVLAWCNGTHWTVVGK